MGDAVLVAHLPFASARRKDFVEKALMPMCDSMCKIEALLEKATAPPRGSILRIYSVTGIIPPLGGEGRLQQYDKKKELIGSDF